MMPSVSVVVPIYNTEQYLRQCLDSLLAQTFTDWECVLWNDASTDGSLAIAQEYVAKDNRFQIHSNEVNEGISKTLSKAIAQSQAPYIGILDSDDWLDSTALQITVQPFLDGWDVGVVYTQHQEVNANGEALRVPSRVAYSSKEMLFSFVAFHFQLFRRRYYNLIGGVDTMLSSAVDYDLFLRLSEVCNFHCVPEPLYFYRLHPGQISSRKRDEQVVNAKNIVQSAIDRQGLALQAVLRYHIEAKN